MGNDMSRARYLTLSSFLINFGVQSYGMLTSPNMKDVADANHYAFSPSPWFIAAFFSGQMILQLAWIRQLFKLDPTENSMDTSDEVESARTSVAYAPVYALGNLCIAGWLLFWLREDFIGSQILVTINTVAQLYAVARLPAITSSSTGLMVLTHLVAKTFAGIGVLDFIDNGGVALRYNAPPSTLIQALTYALFPLAATVSTPFFGSVLLYDVLAIFVGQRSVPAAGLWSTRLGWTALAMGGVVGVKAFLARNKI
ncbi:uncharacterized protein LAESUDRAFT_662326 [Laetiporus sulphureus 93-53]|uniref:Uncharacterized protein n=1 Tax=Laetiporus sulphureus 93-53 TaxID=1314785 RepID=A0A165C5H7_9APHY|nr:uncharacterized protein LAESUDRAFT_662326 [Laetiporus sulphureus 93-53]KZT02241.1 hypothetical protein LAESUDRAFT_662326 [Laetiporus sulphureus 93-53]